jgi:hypothetical protein
MEETGKQGGWETLGNAPNTEKSTERPGDDMADIAILVPRVVNRVEE